MKTESTFVPQWQAAADAVRGAQTILVIAHIAPDGDAIGSLLAIAEPLRALGKDVTAVVDDGIPPELRFVPGSDSVVSSLTEGAFDLMIAVDSSDRERMGAAGAYGLAHSKRSINLDHHPTNTGYGDIQLVVPCAVAAVEVAYDFLHHVGIEITCDVAYALLTGLVTDTQGFRVNATNSRTLEIAQDLMNRGAPLAQIMADTLNSRPFEEVELWRRVLPTVRLDRGLIFASISQLDIDSVGLPKMTDGGLVNYLVNVDRANISIVFKELPERQVEVSFRAKPGYDVARLAYNLGGGGHVLASGCTTDGTLQQVQDMILPLAHQAIAAGAGT